ncbi:MAG: flagellar hook assembly protein FlgD, partial [Alphaproteobacteria bacterium]
METSAIAAATTASSASGIAGAKLAENFDDFLKLLTTQLKYQDPMEPLKSNEFVSQLVQFSQVEQAISTNKNLEKMLRLQEGNLTSVGLDYIGKSVETEGDLAALSGGKAEFSYSLVANAKSTAIAIVNGSGQTVATFKGETAVGRHDFIWDGNDSNGDAAPDGTYRFVIAALDKEGEQIGTATTATSKVTGVENSETGLLLIFDQFKVPFEKIKSAREISPPPA